MYQVYMKIVDCFLFYNELELLAFKLKELTDVVDYFVIVESKYTFRGNDKKLYYEENKSKFADYADKIIHVVHDNNAAKISESEGGRKDGLPDAWSNEREQRFYGTKGLAQLDLADDDIIILSDLDEIADKRTLAKIKNEGLEAPIICLEQDMYYYDLKNKLEEKCYHSKLVRFDKMREYLDKSPDVFETVTRPEYNPDGKHIGHFPIIGKGGWHLSFFGGVSMIKNKIKNFSHVELAHFGDESDEKINEKIQNNKDVFDREEMRFKNVEPEDNDYLPENYKMLI